MHDNSNSLFRAGNVIFRGNPGFGYSLITSSFFFAFRPDDQAAASAGRVGGLLGFFIGAWLDTRRAMKSPPPHLNIPEIVGLDAKIRKKLLKTKLLCSIPLSSGLTVKQESSALVFNATGYPPITYKEILYRKGILKYVQSRGIPTVS